MSCSESYVDINRDILKKHAYVNKPLDYETAYSLGKFVVNAFKNGDEIDKIQSVVALSALHNRATYKYSRAPEQIAGIVSAVLECDIGKSNFGFLNPNIKYAIDNSGMGGDFYRTPNVSTLSALIASYDEIKMCKHGSPGNTDSAGSSDFLEYIGINLFPEKKSVEKALEEVGFGYTDAVDTRYKVIHTATHEFARVAHMNDIIGPMTNPLNPNKLQKKILGVNHLISPEIVAEAYLILNEKRLTNLKHGLFLRGYVGKEKVKGMDEASVFGITEVAELKNDGIEKYLLTPQDFGIETMKYPGLQEKKVELSKKILEGKYIEGFTELILANTSLLFYIERGTDLESGFREAGEILLNGEVSKVVEKYKTIVG